MLKEVLDDLLAKVVDAIRVFYGDRLVSIVLYGSVARGVMRHDSDVDLLVVARDLPHGRLKRVEEFEAVEAAVAEEFQCVASRGIHTTLSAVFKTPEEVLGGSPLFLDMVEDGRVLYDENGFFAQRLARLRNRLAELGAKRIWKGNGWYWDLKPDYKQGEVFEL